MNSQRQQLGRWGEDRAARYLEEKGYQIIARNMHTEHGELDLIAVKDGVLVFVEVKARRSDNFGFPEESITPSKQQHILDSARTFLNEHPEYKGDWRVDVIAIRAKDGKIPEIIHFENAIQE